MSRQYEFIDDGDAPERILARRYVTVRQVTEEGFVEFDFAIGWPELCIEMVLNREAFDEFCAQQRVQFLEPAGRG